MAPGHLARTMAADARPVIAQRHSRLLNPSSQSFSSSLSGQCDPTCSDVWYWSRELVEVVTRQVGVSTPSWAVRSPRSPSPVIAQPEQDPRNVSSGEVDASEEPIRSMLWAEHTC